MVRIYAAGERAVATITDSDTKLTLEGYGSRCLAVNPQDPDTVYAGTTDEGLFKSEDGAQSWERLSGVTHPRITALAVSTLDGAVYAGTEPSSLFVSRDGGESWQELEGLKNLPSAPTWSFPPRPWTSHVRAIALSYEDLNLIVAGIELGGVVKSTDGGKSWLDQRPGAYADCHALATHPAAPNVLYEAAGGGFAESSDFGENFAAADAGLQHRYVWGLAADRDDPEIIYVSAASGPGRAHGGGFSDAAIYRRAGRWSWAPIAERLPEFPYALATGPEAPGSVYAALANGTLNHKPADLNGWRQIARLPGGVEALAVVG
jgi:hypothetical protein